MTFVRVVLTSVASRLKMIAFHPKRRSSRIQPAPGWTSGSLLEQNELVDGDASTHLRHTNNGYLVPAEILALIFCSLSLGECRKSALVCELWSSASRHAQQWLRLDARVLMQKGLSASQSEMFSPICVDYFTQSVARYTDSAEASLWLAKALYARGEITAALQCLWAALDRRPLSVERRQLEACALYMRGEDGLASRVLETALSEAPKDACLHFELGYCYHGMRRFEQAIQQYGEAQQLGYPRMNVLIANRANCLYFVGRISDALLELNLCLTNNPYYFLALRTRAVIYINQGQARLAYKDYTVIIRNASSAEELVSAYCARATCLGTVDESDYDAAMLVDPTDPKPMRGKADLRLDEENYEDAIAIVTEWISKNPTHPELSTQLSYRGSLAAHQGDIEGALRDYNTAMDVLNTQEHAPDMEDLDLT